MVDNNGIHISGIIGEDYSYTDLMKDLNDYNISKRKHINLYIDSPGGYVEEAFTMYDKLQELKKDYEIHTYNDGQVMSAATLLFIAGDERTFDFAKGNLVIHNPFVQVEGDASTMRQYAKELQKIEDRLTNIYASVSKTNQAEISRIMDENRYLTSDEVIRLKLATEVKNVAVAPSLSYAEYTCSTPFAALCKDFDIKMQEKRKINQNNNKRMKVLDFVKTLLKISEIKNLVVTAADGVDYTVTNADESEDLKIGSNITIEGQPYEGQIILADDTVITVEGGVVTKIEQPEEEVKPEQANTETETKNEETVEPKNEDPVEPQETPNQELEDLKVKVDELFGMVTTLAERLNSLEGEKAEVEDMKNKIRNLVSTENAQVTAQTQEEQGKQYHFHFKK